MSRAVDSRIVTPTIATLHNVSVRFGSTLVLDEVDLEVSSGVAIGITGPNGAGKSTLLSVLATLQAPTTGAVAVFGAPVERRDLIAVRRRIGVSAHEPGLYPELTLLENLHLIEKLVGDVKMSAAQALEVVGLSGAGHRLAQASSNGMRRRVDLARLVMTRPELLLLDEAHAGLDASARAIIARLIHRTCEAGGAAVVVSHDRSILDAGELNFIRTVVEGRLQ